MIKYIGSKRVLVPILVEVVSKVQPSGSVLDLFSGTSRVGHALKRSGYCVFSNDHNAYAATLGRCYVQADREDHYHAAGQLVKEFNKLSGVAGYFTETFCVQSRFFHPKNGERIDTIREAIVRKGLDPEFEAVMLVSLMEAADRVDSTTGVQMAYLKDWAPRAHNDLELRIPDLLPRAPAGKGAAHQLDALEAVAQLQTDICYIDPPYNQHKYLGNYHVWESLVLWDKPEVYGIACKRIDCKDRGSVFNSKPNAGEALRTVFEKVKARHLVVSFNNEGYFSREEIEGMLANRGHLVVIEQDFKRYVGAQIGIHNLKGEKVGEVSHLRNTEYIYVVTPDGQVAQRLRDFCEHLGVAAYEATTVGLPSAPSAGARVTGGARETPKPGSSDSSQTDLNGRLRELLRSRGTLTSAEAQSVLGCDAAVLRTLLRVMIEDGTVSTSGQRRGMRYHWAGSLAQRPPTSPAMSDAARTADTGPPSVLTIQAELPASTQIMEPVTMGESRVQPPKPRVGAQQQLFPVA